MLLKKIKRPIDHSNSITNIKANSKKIIYLKNQLNKNLIKIDFKKDFNQSKSCYTPIKIKPLVSYIININLSRSNIILSITDKQGDLKGYYTSGILGFKGSQKTKKYTLITLLKNFLYNFNYVTNKSVIINFKGVIKDQKLFIKKLKEKVFIKAITYNNLLPHNGCRPKKIRRK